MKNRKTLITILTLSVALVGCKDVEPVDEETEVPYVLLAADADNQVLYKMTNTHESDVTYVSETISVSRNAKYFTDDRNLKVYRGTVATFAMTLSADAYPWEKISICDENGKVDNTKDLYKELGIKDKKEIIVENADNDIAGVVAGNFLFLDGETKYQVFTIAFRGTVDNKEWISNLDMGADTSSYITESNPCSEWKNKNNHKGFDVAINRISPLIDSYINEFKDEEANQVMFVTGHSRGGALANIYGAMLEDRNIKNVTYTFASPRTYVPTEEKQYKSIFNILNEGDVITQVPTEEMGFKRYGVDKKFSNEQITNKFEEVSTSIEYKHTSSMENILNALNGFISNRNDVYEKLDDYDSEAFSRAKTSEDIARYLEEDKALAKEKGIDKYIEFGEPYEKEGSYYYDWKYSKAILFSMVSEFLNLENVDFSAVLNLLYTYIHLCPEIANQVLTQLVSFGDIIMDTNTVKVPHYPETYLTCTLL